MPDNTGSTPQDVISILRGVMDPELNDNIVDLGMVRSAEVEDGEAVITIALTTAGCPLRATIKRDVQHRVETLPDITSVTLRWDELTADEKARTMERARAKARDDARPTRVPTSTRVLAIASGKGGVGKSSVTVNLAAGLAAKGHTVGVLDADIWGFSVPRMLGVSERLEAERDVETDRPVIRPEKALVGDGEIQVVSMGLLVESEDSALMWRGLMLAKAVEQFLNDVAWGDMDYLLVDMPPGTGDVQMALARLLPQAEMIVITTPALGAQKVASRVADMARRSHMPVVGVIENMGAFVAPDGASYPLFGQGGGQRLSDEIGAPLIGSIPLEPAVGAGGDEGVPVALGSDGPASIAIRGIVERLVDEISPPTDIGGCSARMLAAIDDALGALDRPR
ncbi:MAG: Mrp/NBP35 family ATP-binding protein [Actinomycetia bacterium]|nr:Mrp/NBP35 family ATP-binding protein [Actinomycetes bacterium]MCP4961579.1 Mrp/NBP35 family ATP-binding protein [Actinomycetes bacterium]